MGRGNPEQASQADALARYLRQSRLTRPDDTVVPGLADIYRENHRVIRDCLGYEDNSEPALHVVCTLNAETETVTVDGHDIIVHDQSLSQAFNQLNDFALAEWPADLVLQWSLKALAFALVGLDLRDAALAAIYRHQQRSVSERPAERLLKAWPLKILSTAVQEYFVLAHEWAHITINRRKSPNAEATLGGLIDKTIGIVEAGAREADASVLQKSVAARELKAMSSSPMAEASEDPDFVEWVKNRPLPEWPSFAAAIAAREHLREEIICDLLATQLVMERFAGRNDVDMATILSMVLHGFHNLTSLEVIRQIARDQTKSSSDSQIVGISMRKVVWRQMVLGLLGDRVGGADALDEKFVEVTELHSRTVSDHLVSILPAEFEWAFGRTKEAGLTGVTHEQIAELIGLSRTAKHDG